MEQRDYEKLEKMLCKELKEITDKGELSAGSLDVIDKLTHALKNTYKIHMGYDGEYSNADGEWSARGGYSNARGSKGYSRDRMMPMSYDDGYGNSYNDGSPGARRGQHYVRGHYSYANGMDMVEQKIMEMMNEPNISINDKQTLQRALEVMR